MAVIALSLQNGVATAYKTSARIKKDASDIDFVVFAFFFTSISSRAPRASSRSASDRVGKRVNIEYFVGFIDSCDGETTLMNFMEIWQMHEHGGDELLLILGRF